MSNITRYEADGYSIGSIIPDGHKANIGTYHPSANRNSGKYKISLKLKKNSARILNFKIANNDPDWSRQLRIIFLNIDFIEDPNQIDTLIPQSPINIALGPSGYKLTNIEIKVSFDTNNAPTFYREKLTLTDRAGQTVYSDWFWIPQ